MSAGTAKLNKINKKTFRSQLIEKFTQLVTTGFGLVAALAWNEAIQGLFARYKDDADTLAAKFIYALIVTFLVVAITVQLGRMASYVNKTS